MEERRKESKTENSIENAAFSNQMIVNPPQNSFSMPNRTLFDISCEEAEADHQQLKSSFGFIDMLSAQDFYNPCSSTFDDLFQNITSHVNTPPLPSPPPSTTVPEYSEVVNTPVTPNSSSMSSSSTDQATANHDEQKKINGNTVEEGEENQGKTKKQLKPQKKKQKREKEARFAFMTKSEVDHLDDGYRWRKYGQKAVKNSPFPRSYYRCTSTACGVKKRVERSHEDPSIVVTTYEGTHTHPCPITQRGSFGMLPETSTFGGGGGGGGGRLGGGASSHFTNIPQMLNYQHRTQQQQQQPYFRNFTQPMSFSTSNYTTPTFPPPFQERPFCPSASSLARDHGLLQDMLPSQLLKERKDQEE